MNLQKSGYGGQVPRKCEILQVNAAIRYATRKAGGRLGSLQLFMLMFMLMLHPAQLKSQEFYDTICRIDEGRLIFRIDLDWTREQLRKVSDRFNIDTMLLPEIMTDKLGSGALANGWQVRKINSRTVELSRALSPQLPDKQGSRKSVPPVQLFLIDDNRMPGEEFPESAPARYGVNRLTTPEIFTYSDTIAIFFLPGNSGARHVYLSGTFNGWSTMKTPMSRSDRGWEVRLKLMPGKYAYKYIIDGRWTQDPGNLLRESDLYGGNNSIIFCYNHWFSLQGYTGARRVFVAGSFNDYHPDELRMNFSGDGWELPIYVAPGTHAYKFVVDGSWITDPANPVVRPDGAGNYNSFMGIGDTTWFRIKGFKSTGRMNLAGSFNVWNKVELVMEKTADGWQLPYVMAPGNYEYKYIADGRWMIDPANPHVIGEGDRMNSFLAVKPNHTFVVDSFAGARHISVTGSFNGWNRSGYALARLSGRWVLPLYLKPGKHTYKFIIDGKWELDPANELWEENEFGTGNSVLWIER